MVLTTSQMTSVAMCTYPFRTVIGITYGTPNYASHAVI